MSIYNKKLLSLCIEPNLHLERLSECVNNILLNKETIDINSLILCYKSGSLLNFVYLYQQIFMSEFNNGFLDENNNLILNKMIKTNIVNNEKLESLINFIVGKGYYLIFNESFLIQYCLKDPKPKLFLI